MFHNIPKDMRERMRYLEQKDAQDGYDGTPKKERLRQIPPETGKLLSLLAASSPSGNYVEIGTSGGYSTMWLALAAKQKKCNIKTFEVLPEKIKVASETFQIAGIEDMVTIFEGDAMERLVELDTMAFCFLDAEKNRYQDYYELVKTKIIKGGFLVADNILDHWTILENMVEKVLNDNTFDSVVVPIGDGLLVSKKV